MSSENRRRRLSSLTERILRLTALWTLAGAVVAVPFFLVSARNAARVAGEAVATLVGTTIVDTPPERINGTATMLAAEPTIRGITVLDGGGRVLQRFGSPGVFAPSAPLPANTARVRDIDGESVYLYRLNPSARSEQSLRVIAVWPDRELFLRGNLVSAVKRTAFLLALFGVLIATLILTIRTRYLKPLRKLTFAVRDGRTSVLTEIAASTDAVEFHTMIASFLGLMSQNERRHEELEEAVQERTQELEQAQAVLVRQEKLASLGRLAAGVAHEINNPAGYVVGNVQVLREYVDHLRLRLERCDNVAALLREIASNGGHDRADLRAAVEMIGTDDDEKEYAFIRGDIDELFEALRDGMERITTIVHGLNSFARERDTEPEVVDVATIVENSLRIVVNELKYDYVVRHDVAGKLPVNVVSNQIEQVLVNMLINARDATPKGGEITVHAREVDGNAVISISDTGAGMPAETVAKVFDPFFTTKPIGSGTGLGLAICHEIISDSNGEISVESVEGEGTRFDITLPIVPEEVEEITDAV